jgi:hypothetical protein
MGEPFIISINNTDRVVTIIEFFADGNLKCVTHSNRVDASTLTSSSAIDVSKKNFEIFELYENDDEDGLINEESKLTTAIAGVRYFDDKNVIIEQSPKYMFSNGLFHKVVSDRAAITSTRYSEQIVAYVPWHLIHLKNVGEDQIEVDVYLSNNKVTSLKEEIYVNTLVNKNLFKTSYTNNFFDDSYGIFAYGLHNEMFKDCIIKVAKEIAAVTRQLNIVSQQDFINYNTAFINQQNNSFYLKTNLENIIEQYKFDNQNQKDIASCNEDVLNLFKNSILDNPKIVTGHEALYFLINAQVIDLDENKYKVVNVWKDFEYNENIYSPELSIELLQELDHWYLSNIDNQSLVNNYVTYNENFINGSVIEDTISFEDVNNFFVDIEQNINPYSNTSLESL